MQTSPKGVAALELEEGVVLKAYPDVVGVWTIGAGLTAASGVVKPRAGMVITRAEATALLQKALRDRYEPAVERAMAITDKPLVERPAQHAFDAGVSFHWNCGTIAKASWVKLWKAKGARSEIRFRLKQWNKGGGKVLPGLTARRDREADMLLDGIYRPDAVKARPTDQVYSFARWGILLSGAEIMAVRAAFVQAGYKPGTAPNDIMLEAVLAFQRDHDLTADGIIGRATLTTLQRQIDARRKVKAPAATMAVSSTLVSTDYAETIANLPWAWSALLIGGVLWAAYLGYRYRDVVAAEIAKPLPRLAAYLRSF